MTNNSTKAAKNALALMLGAVLVVLLTFCHPVPANAQDNTLLRVYDLDKPTSDGSYAVLSADYFSGRDECRESGKRITDALRAAGLRVGWACYTPE